MHKNAVLINFWHLRSTSFILILWTVAKMVLKLVIFLSLFHGIFGIKGSQMACMDMIPMDTFVPQTSEIPYEVNTDHI